MMLFPPLPPMSGLAGLAGLAFPAIDPVAAAIGPLVIRWYALAYVAGLVLGWLYALHLARKRPDLVSPAAVDGFLLWATVGVILGGRLGYVLFYRPEFYLEHPLEILAVWQGGMAFHGGLLGVAAALILYARHRGLRLWALADIVACAAPIGLFFGRLANFINGELWGRASDVPWAIVFPGGGPAPRHPSQLYEAVLEGLVLFCLLYVLSHHRNLAMRLRNHSGRLCGLFLAGYGLARLSVEVFREPDAHLGFLLPVAGGITMGQLLSLPLLAAGIYLALVPPGRPPTERS